MRLLAYCELSVVCLPEPCACINVYSVVTASLTPVTLSEHHQGKNQATMNLFDSYPIYTYQPKYDGLGKDGV